jgi:hypothetical protein
MQNIRKVAPGQRGAKRLLDQYGAKLICVRYRYDGQRQKRCKTVELIIEEAPWTPPPAHIANETLVGLRVAFKEVELQRRVKQAGGKWNPTRRVWELRYDQVVALGLKDRIEEPKVSGIRNLRAPHNYYSYTP